MRDLQVIDGVYALKEKIGQGGMAAVYRAELDLDRFDYTTLYAYTQVSADSHHERRRKAEELAGRLHGQKLDPATLRAVLEAQNIPVPPAEVAVKIAIGESEPARFEAEWKDLLCLNHPNVVNVYGGGVYMGRPYYSMELLRNIVPSKRVIEDLTLAQKLDIALQAGRGLAYLHRNGLVHRDVKPDNATTCEVEPGRFVVKITDLGIAKNLEATVELTQTHTLMGTPHYMAPEQIMSSRKVDHRADIYSLGATLYQLVSRKRPFHDKTTVYEVIAAVSRGTTPAPVSELAPALPGTVAAIIGCAMYRDRDLRYASMDDFVADLETFLAGGSDAKAGRFRFEKLLPQQKEADARDVATSTVVAPAAAPAPAPAPPPAAAPKAAAAPKRIVVVKRPASKQGGASQEAAAPKAEVVEQPVPPPARPRRIGGWLVAAGVTAALVVAAVFGVGAYRRAHRPPPVPVPTPAQQSVVPPVAPVSWPAPDLRFTGSELQAAFAGSPPPKMGPFAVRRTLGKGPKGAVLEIRDDAARRDAVLRVHRAGDFDTTAVAGLDRDMKAGKVFRFGRATDYLWVLAPPASVPDPAALVAGPGPTTVPAGRPASAGKVPTTEAELHAALKAANPAYSGSGKVQVAADGIVGLDLSRSGVTDLSPLRGLPLKTLRLQGTPVSDLSPLRGMPITDLMLEFCPNVADLSPLAGMPLTRIWCGGKTKVSDLSPLAGMPLTCIIAQQCKIRDLTPLKGMKLGKLQLEETEVSDLSLLTGVTVESLYVAGCSNLTDLTPLAGMALRDLSFSPRKVSKGLNAVRAIGTLQKVGIGEGGHMYEAAAFWARYDAGEFGKAVAAAGSQTTPAPAPVGVMRPGDQRKPGETMAVDLGGGVNLDLVWIPPGTFTMGSPKNEEGRNVNEEQHSVTLTRGFWMGKYEVTEKQWACVTSDASRGARNVSVASVSWNDCRQFLEKLNAQSAEQRRGLSVGAFRFPTEAEWEYACRARTTTAYCGGNLASDLDVVGWCRDNSTGGPHPGGEKQSNAWGLYDMHGNVWEWCQDYGGMREAGLSATSEPVTDPVGPTSGATRVFRGGSRNDAAAKCRSAFRWSMDPAFKNGNIGFRIALASGSSETPRLGNAALAPALPDAYRGRSAEGRRAALAEYGGTPSTEVAVLRALRWLKQQQSADGSWPRTKPAMTAMALLSFLAHGETPASAEFGVTVEKAIRWFVENQEPNGHFKGRDGHDYSHPIATHAVCEAYGMTRDPTIKEVAEKALQVVVRGQTADGGFNYNLVGPSETRNDTSYMGWCAQALSAAKTAGLAVEGLDACMVKAIQGFRKNYSEKNGYGEFGYTTSPDPGQGKLTGSGVLSLQCLGAGSSNEAQAGLRTLSGATFNWQGGGQLNLNYYWHYITQAKFHAGGEAWNKWNVLFSPTLVTNQTIIANGIEGPDGKLSDVGYWQMPLNISGHTDGDVMNTCLCLQQLQVYYRYPRLAGAPSAPAVAPAPSTASLRSLGLGATFRDYRIELGLGKGGMGEVYLATQVSTARPVLFRVCWLQSTDGRDKEAQRFLAQARLAVQLRHPNIVATYEADQQDGACFVAMAYSEAANVASQIKSKISKPNMDEKVALRIVRDVASGMAYAWNERRVIHCDIKPANVQFDRVAGRAQVMMNPETMADAGNPLSAGAIVGTPGFMSPEQAEGRTGIDVRSDIYSLGATLYAMLTGQAPFAGNNLQETLRKQQTEPPPDPRQANANVSDGCARLAQRMMARKPDDRVASWEALIGEIDRLSGDLPPSPATSAGSPSSTDAPDNGRKAGDAMTVDLGGGVNLDLVWIPPGKFTMGSPKNEEGRNVNEEQHSVTLTRGFWMGKYEVTQELWEKVMGKNPSKFKGAKNPVEQVSWNDCREFIDKLNDMTSGGGFRLPTEAEWEYACRAGTTDATYLDALNLIAWHPGNSEGTTHPVGKKRANAWGLHDMIGNVFEWCQDWHGAYTTDSVTDSVGPSSGSSRVLRGGGWCAYSAYCRAAYRGGAGPASRRIGDGFRVVCVR
jgi:formylglycine-generating enzyme required for sulfatase activity/prenyltransferase beta subunit